MSTRSLLGYKLGSISASWVQDRLKGAANENRWLVYKQLQDEIDALEMYVLKIKTQDKVLIISKSRPKGLCAVCRTTEAHIPQAAALKVPTVVLRPSNDQTYLSVDKMAIQALSCQLCRLMFTSMIVDESRWSKNDHNWLHSWTPVIELQHETRTEQYLVFRSFHDLEAQYRVESASEGLGDTKLRRWEPDDRKRLTVRSMISAYSITCTLEVGCVEETFITGLTHASHI
jgi:hypothetical protein